MDWSLIADYINALIASFLLVISLVLIPEIRAKKKYWISIIGLIIFSSFLGYDKLRRDNLKESEYEKKIAHLDSNYNKLANAYSNDTLRYASFLDSLKSNFGIIRDPTSNSPVIIYQAGRDVNNVQRDQTINNR